MTKNWFSRQGEKIERFADGTRRGAVRLELASVNSEGRKLWRMLMLRDFVLDKGLMSCVEAMDGRRRPMIDAIRGSGLPASELKEYREARARVTKDRLRKSR